MHIFRTQFLYALIKERYNVSTCENSKIKTDTILRVVFWDNENGGYFVIYGTRPESKHSGTFTPYRIKCTTVEQVCQFAKIILSTESNIAVELHQFDALNDDSEDPLNIDWENNAENGSTELVAYDFVPVKNKNGVEYVPFKKCFGKILRQLICSEII